MSDAHPLLTIFNVKLVLLRVRNPAPFKQMDTKYTNQVGPELKSCFKQLSFPTAKSRKQKNIMKCEELSKYKYF